MMLDEGMGLRQLGTTARNSSTRAYAGHSSEMRHIFDVKKMNLTEYARSFGLYKQLYLVNQKEKAIKEDRKKKGIYDGPSSKNKEPQNVDIDDLDKKYGEDVDLDKVIEDNQNIFSRRL